MCLLLATVGEAKTRVRVVFPIAAVELSAMLSVVSMMACAALAGVR